MSWTMWLVPPIITSIFFTLGIITLYWSIFTWVTAKAESSRRPYNIKRVQVIVGTTCAVVSVFALQLIVRDSHLSWTFTNFQLLLLIFVAYFLALKIPNWLILLAGVGFMLLNGNVTAVLSWGYTFVYVLFYWLSYQQSTHLWRAPYTRYISVAAVFGLVLWLFVKTRFQLPWTTYWTEIGDYLVLASLMYGYFKIQDKDRRIKDRLFQSANWDALTHVQNYAAYDRAVSFHFHQSAAHQRNLGMIMFDIDHFKHINDTYGHLAGDEVLKQVASTVTTILKPFGSDVILYRTGGEEFNILLPDRDLNRARPIAQEVFDAVKGLTTTYNGQDLNVTISVGVSVLHERDRNPLDFYKRVDANLYHSKQTGRHRITAS
ncbi:GGDEF domain-containing protein [Levilactobacillus angrenensis]|uniref:GGDEF domain-containing protein n=1 Tax=Levilactobacillus angrenensis TaxID=2486020 RepID=A0ABW1UAY0_9LACO|nr:GGDEF domain-containing protein [Levilactobacillus angrenensis]